MIKRFINWLLSLFTKKVAEVLDLPEPECHLIPDPTRRMAPKGRKPIKPQPTPTPTPTTTGQALIFINFNGETVQDAGWNGGQRFTCAASNLNAESRQQALWAVQAAYARYNIIVTDNRLEYDAYTSRKQMVIVTPTSAWYPNLSYSGVAKIGGIGSGSPAFVFEDRLYTRWDYVGDIIIHEAGHTLGLRHQSEYSTNCTLVNTYRRGCHMGSPFDLDAAWVVGPTYTCTTIQDDDGHLARTYGLR